MGLLYYSINQNKPKQSQTPFKLELGFNNLVGSQSLETL